MGVNVALVSPPSRAYNHYRPPLALMYISAYLEQGGISTNIVDAKISPFPAPGEDEKTRILGEILRQVEASDPQIVGLTCYTPEFVDVIGLARMIKERLRNVNVVVGGVHPTLRPEDFLYVDSPIDYAVMGEGEITMLELVKAIRDGKAYEDVLGIAFLDKSKGDVVKTEPRPLIQNLDELPFPAFDKLDMKYYTTPNPYSIRGVMFSSFYVLTGRGCPSSCTFCVAKHLRKTAGPGRYLRFRSARNVVDELEILVKNYCMDAFYIIDDAFTINMQYADAFCDELLSRDLKLPWACTTRVNRVSENLLRKMRKAGCVQIDFGVESGSERLLKSIRKGITVTQIREAFGVCRKVGIRTFANILINIPSETEEDIEATLTLLDEIKPTLVSFNIFIPYLGTDIYKEQALNLTIDEYAVLGYPPTEIIRDPRFLYTDHDIDLAELYRINHKKYNPLWNSTSILFSTLYLKTLLRSRRKMEYIVETQTLLKELMKQLRQ